MRQTYRPDVFITSSLFRPNCNDSFSLQKASGSFLGFGQLRPSPRFLKEKYSESLDAESNLHKINKLLENISYMRNNLEDLVKLYNQKIRGSFLNLYKKKFFLSFT